MTRMAKIRAITVLLLVTICATAWGQNVFTNAQGTMQSQWSTSPSGPRIQTGSASLSGLPEFNQPAATSGQGQMMAIRGQTDATGSGGQGGPLAFIMGKPDATSFTNIMWFGYETAAGGHPTAAGNNVNFFTLATLFSSQPGGIVELALGGGPDNHGTGVSAVEFASDSPISIATESFTTHLSPVSILPQNNRGGAQSQFIFNDDPGNGPQLQFTNFGTVMVPSNTGIMCLPWENSTTEQVLVSQRNSANNDDLGVITRESGVLTYGSMLENHQDWTQSGQVFQSQTAGTGYQFTSIAGGTAATFVADGNSTWLQGDAVHDMWRARIWQADTAATGLQTIATIPLTDGTDVVTQLKVTVNAREISTADFATLSETWTYVKNSGTITAASGSQPAATDNGHSTAATGIGPQFAISGGNINVTATPWTASAVHWETRSEETINAKVAAATPAPPGSPIFWFRADKQALGSTSVLTDQSGSNHSTTGLLGSASSITASTGPGGTLPSLVFTGSSSIYYLLNALIGTKNFSIDIVARVTSTSSQQIFTASGTFASPKGQAIGVDLDNTQSWSFDQAGFSSIDDGPANTSWAAIDFSSDANGNLTCLINGVPHYLNPSNGAMVAPDAVFTIGGDNTLGGQITGNIYEELVYSPAISNFSVYSYQHAQTGL